MTTISKPRPEARGHSGFWTRVAPPRVARHSQCILVVDDEPLILSFVGRVLASEGYEVVTARDSESALGLLLEPNSDFAMLLSDVGLPGLSGAELVHRAHSIDPTLPALLMSADRVDSLVLRGVLSPGTELLAKPFSAGTLTAKVEQPLETRSHTLPG